MFDAIRDCLLHFVTAAALGKSYQSSAHDGGLSPPHKSKHKSKQESKHGTNTKINIAIIARAALHECPGNKSFSYLSRLSLT